MKCQVGRILISSDLQSEKHGDPQFNHGENSVEVQLRAWCRTGNKQLPEPITDDSVHSLVPQRTTLIQLRTANEQSDIRLEEKMNS